jgi:CRP/FNR family transcriptional regulator, anaerobic regulatory protein
MDKKIIFKNFPFYRKTELVDEIFNNATLVTLKKGEILIREGQYLKTLPLVIEGSIRVFQQIEDREILLYYVEAGESCTMSLSACFFNNPSTSQAIAEANTQILNIPVPYIHIWQRKYPEWNTFIVKTFHDRYNELLSSFNMIVFKNIEYRVVEYLHHYVEKNGVKIIPVTHIFLANELGTTRVVISRILKHMEEDKKVVLMRSGIKLLK